MDVSTSGFLRIISRVVSTVVFDFWRIFIVRIWSHVGIVEVFGLQGSFVHVSGKSEVISHVSKELSAPSKSGVKRRFILQLVNHGLHAYSVKEVSSFASKSVGDCQTNAEVTRKGLIEVSTGGFLRMMVRVATTEESVFLRI